MSVVLCSLKLPTTPDSQPAFESFAQELLAAHPAVLRDQQTAIKLGVDLTGRHALALSPLAGITSVAFSSRQRSVQQLSLVLRSPSNLLTGISFENLAVGEYLEKKFFQYRLRIKKEKAGNYSARAIRSRTVDDGELQSEMSPCSVEEFQSGLWLLMLARAWKRVYLERMPDGDFFLLLSQPRPDPAKACRRISPRNLRA